jgi:hypothetical protein
VFFLLLLLPFNRRTLESYLILSLFCVRNDYITGRWIHENCTDIKKPFVCCIHNDVETFVHEKYCLPLIPTFNKTEITKTAFKFRYNPNPMKFFMYPEGDGCSCGMSEGSYSAHNRKRYYCEFLAHFKIFMLNSPCSSLFLYLISYPTSESTCGKYVSENL